MTGVVELTHVGRTGSVTGRGHFIDTCRHSSSREYIITNSTPAGIHYHESTLLTKFTISCPITEKALLSLLICPL